MTDQSIDSKFLKIVGPAIFSAVSANGVVPATLKALDLPDCLTYADSYRGVQSVFKRDGPIWRESFGIGSAVFEFREVRRTREFIELLNLTPRADTKDSPLVVRLPVCGGTAKISVGVPERWINLADVWRP